MAGSLLSGSCTRKSNNPSTTFSGINMADNSKPIVSLLGEDGNAFMIIGRCLRAARKAGWTDKQVEAFQDEATKGDYDKVLQTAQKYFEVR